MTFDRLDHKKKKSLSIQIIALQGFFLSSAGAASSLLSLVECNNSNSILTRPTLTENASEMICEMTQAFSA